MRKIKFLLAFLLFSNLSLFAQNASENRTLDGDVVDYVTMEPLGPEIEIKLLSKDSVFINDADIYLSDRVGKQKCYFIMNIDKPGDYILKCFHPNYHTLYQSINVATNVYEMHLGKLLMKRKMPKGEALLDEVEVKATKLKFYFRKDTLVYDAKEFLTQKGFVLNDILKKMPGIEVHSNGEILSNGRKVSVLLLNGKDFFDRDRKDLLENLPAFQVKEVKIYDKKKDSLSLIKREREFEGYVMDIKLKKEYKEALFANADLGIGTDHRYYGKLFGLKFNAVSKILAYTLLNNINRDEMIMDNGAIYNFDNGNGDKTNDKFCFSYNLDDPRGGYALKGDAQLQYIDNLSKTESSVQSFYTAGDVFSRNLSRIRQYVFSAKTSHDLNFFGNTNYDFTLRPSMNYTRIHVGKNQLNVSMRDDAYHLLGEFWRDSLTSAELCQSLRLYGISRQIEELKNNGHSSTAKMEILKDLRPSCTNDILHFEASGTYEECSNDLFRHNITDYLSEASQSTDSRNMYQRMTSYDWDWKGLTSYRWSLSSRNSLEMVLEYEHKKSKDNNSLFALHKLSGWDCSHQIGLLPSQEDLLDVLDANNSRYLQIQENRYNGKLIYGYESGEGHKNTKLTITLPFKYDDKHLRLLQNTTDTLVKRTIAVPDVTVEFIHQNIERTGYSYNVSYQCEHNMPSLINLVNIHDDSNPLLTTHGNSNLKNTVNHMFSGNLYWLPSWLLDNNFSLSYSINRDMVAMSALYNKTTGRMDITPRNVNGNNDLHMELKSNVYLKRDRSSLFSNNLSFDWNNSADYSGTDFSEVSQRSLVHNFNIKENLTYSIMSKNTKCHLDLIAYMYYYHSTSSRLNFERMNSYDFGGKCNLSVELPWDMNLQTDITSVSRRGYNYDEMNEDEYLWNMTLSKSFGEKIKIQLDADDILGQRKNVYRFVNAQARTETFYNNIRRYGMLHFIWKIN